jgi:hypothetical protein
VAPPLIITIWLIASLILILLLRRKHQLLFAAIGLYVLIGWMLLDLRWTINGIKQSSRTLAYFQDMTEPAHLDLGGDQQVAELVQEAKRHIADGLGQTLIFSTFPDMRFQLLRAKYQLLPAAAIVHEGTIATIPLRQPAYVLVVNPAYLEPGQTIPNPEELAEVLQKRLGTRVSVLWGNATGTLFKVLGS